MYKHTTELWSQAFFLQRQSEGCLWKEVVEPLDTVTCAYELVVMV